MKLAFVTDAPYVKDVRLQRSLAALNGCEGLEVFFVLDQGMFTEESAALLTDSAVTHFPAPIPTGGVKKLLWHLSNRFCSLSAHARRSVWIEEKLLALRPDIIHCINPFSLEACSRAAEKLDAFLVYEAYEYWPDYIDALGARVPISLAKKLKEDEGRYAGAADAFIAVSEPLALWYQEEYSLASKPISILNINAPDADACVLESSKLSRADEASMSQASSELSLIYSGIITDERNVDLAIEALSSLPKVHLSIQGDGPAKGRLENMVRSRGLQNQIKFIPPCPPEDLIGSLRNYDLGINLLLPETKQMEGALPNKAFDYLRAGLGIISSDTQGMRSLQGVQESFVYLGELSASALADVLAGLQDDRARLEELKNSSRANAGRYTRAHEQDKLRKIYRTFYGARKNV